MGKCLSTNSKLLALKPKLDDDGQMRSDRRLTHAKFLSYDVLVIQSFFRVNPG